jgi:hypothetical protein
MHDGVLPRQARTNLEQLASPTMFDVEPLQSSMLTSFIMIALVHVRSPTKIVVMTMQEHIKPNACEYRSGGLTKLGVIPGGGIRAGPSKSAMTAAEIFENKRKIKLVDGQVCKVLQRSRFWNSGVNLQYSGRIKCSGRHITDFSKHASDSRLFLPYLAHVDGASRFCAPVYRSRT